MKYIFFIRISSAFGRGHLQVAILKGRVLAARWQGERKHLSKAISNPNRHFTRASDPRIKVLAGIAVSEIIVVTRTVGA